MTYQHSDYAAEFKQRAQADWDAALAFSSGEGPAPARPYQVEIHPHREGSTVCRWQCIDCHGRFQRQRPGLSFDTWLTLIDDLKAMRVPSVVLSGNYSDPSTDEELLTAMLHVMGPTWGVKLHTYGTGLTPTIRQAILHAADTDPLNDSYLTLSKHTTDAEVFEAMCHPSSNADGELMLEQANLKRMFREAEGSRLTVRLNCRVTQLNASGLTDLLRWLAKVSPTVPIRFTTDYEPAHAPQAYLTRFYDDVFVPTNDAQLLIHQAVEQSGIDPSRISFRGVDTDQSKLGWTNRSCYSSLLFSAVGASGHVFMCQGLASRVNSRFIYGDLRRARFPELWTRFLDGWDNVDCCRCAGECEHQINRAMTLDLGVTDGTV